MAPDEFGVLPTQVAQLVTPPAFPAATQNDLASFNLDEAVRLRTAGKGYKPAPQLSLCAHCAKRVRTTDSVLIKLDASGARLVYHADCR